MKFEWSEDKNEANLRKHGVDFADAALIFEGWTLDKIDERQDYGEVRVVSLGMVDDDCFVVVHTKRKDAVRIISAWKGGRDERERYEEGLSREIAGDAE